MGPVLRYVQFVVAHRVWVLFLLVAISLAAMSSLRKVQLGSSFEKIFFGDDPAYAAYEERIAEYATDEVVFLAYEDPAPLSPASLARLGKAVDGLTALPLVGEVRSLLNAPRITMEEGMLRVEPWGDVLLAADADELPGLRAALEADPSGAGHLISGDGGALVVELTVVENRMAESVAPVVGEMLDAMESAGFSREKVHRGGLIALTFEMLEQTYENAEVRLPMCGLLLLITVLLLFRRLAPALVSFGIAFVSVVWTMGFAAEVEPQFSVFMTMVPAIVLVVSFSDTVHLWSAFDTELASGLSRKEAIEKSGSEVGKACLLTSITTFLGYISLVLVPTPMFQVSAVVLSFGVAVALLLAMTLVPIVLSFIPTPSPEKLRKRIGARNRIQPVIDWMARVSIHKPRRVAGIGLVLLLGSLWALTHLTIDANFTERLAADNDYRLDEEHITEHYPGVNSIQVFVDLPGPDAVFDPETFANLTAWQDAVDALPQVDASISLMDLMSTIHTRLGGKEAAPPTRPALAQYLLLFELAGGEDLHRLVSFDRSTLRVPVQINEGRLRGTWELAEEIQALGLAHLGPEVRVDTTGVFALLGAWLDDIIRGQRNGLLLSVSLISVMMVLGFKSVRIGLLSMIPNLFPLLLVGGGMAITWPHVDSDTLVVAIMAIGIGVDDTIHFLTRFRLESHRIRQARAVGSGVLRLSAAERVTALQRTYNFAGMAIVLTTVILALGHLPMATSDYFSVWAVGALLPMVFVVALLADLMLVPAMVSLGLMGDAAPLEPEGPSSAPGLGDRPA
jgi:predicted RND superfamily exporter protein